MGVIVWSFDYDSLCKITKSVLGLYKNRLIEVDVYQSSDDTYAFVPDSQRNDSWPQVKNRYILCKVNIDVYAGKSLNFESIQFVLEDDKNYYLIEEPRSNAPDEIRQFFGPNPFGQVQSERPDGRVHILERGVAIRLRDAFPNLPSGGYHLFAIIVLDNLLVSIPMRLASLRDPTFSVIRDRPLIFRKVGRSVDVLKVAKEHDRKLIENNYLSRIRLFVLDFDFLPWTSRFHSFHLKTTEISRPK